MKEAKVIKVLLKKLKANYKNGLYFDDFSLEERVLITRCIDLGLISAIAFARNMTTFSDNGIEFYSQILRYPLTTTGDKYLKINWWSIGKFLSATILFLITIYGFIRTLGLL